MDNNQKHMLTAIMAETFAAVDMNLFLDTHPDEKRALADFFEIIERLENLKNQYEKKYGPLNSFSLTDGEQSWRWIEEPWPWEINFA